MPLLNASLHVYSYCKCHILHHILYTTLFSHKLHFLLYVHTDNYKLCTHHFPNHVLHLLILPYHSSHIFSDVFLLSVPTLPCRCDLPDFFLYIPCRSFRRQHPLYSLLLLRCARMHNHILHKRRLSTYDFLFLTLLYHSNHISFHALSLSVSILLFQYDYLHLFLHTQYDKYHKLPSAYKLRFHLYGYSHIRRHYNDRLPKYVLLH